MPGAIVCFWHLADIPTTAAFVRFWGTADNGGFWPAMVCPLMTQSGAEETKWSKVVRDSDAHQ